MISKLSSMLLILLNICHQIAYSNHEILMLINPQKSHIYFSREKTHDFFHVEIRIEDISTNQVALVEKESNYKYGSWTTEKQSPEAWQILLNSGSKKSYPIHWHKKFNFLHEKDELKIYIYHDSDDNGDNYLLSNIPQDICSKILIFMRTDQQAPEITSFDFIKTVKFNFFNYSIKNTCLFGDGLLFIDKSKIEAGDAILLFITEEGEDLSDMKFIIKHFALALGDNMYLSKLDYGGFLHVCSLQTMLDASQCDEYGKINDSALSNPNFWKMFE